MVQCYRLAQIYIYNTLFRLISENLFVMLVKYESHLEYYTKIYVPIQEEIVPYCYLEHL